MIIDSHLHLWVDDPQNYPWQPIGGYVPEKEAPLSQYLKIMEENKLSGAVLVQPTPYGWNNSYLLACKETDPGKFRAVVLVDPLSEGAPQSLRELAGHGADGLRINLLLQALREWDNKYFLMLWKSCEDLKLPVCLQLTPDYLDLVNELADAYATKIIVDHLGRPIAGCATKDEEFERLLKMSAQPNIYIKLSGMNYYSNEPAPYQDTWKLLQTVKQAFGPERCLWGSDFPFVEEHWSFNQNLDLFINELDFSETDIEWILGRTSRSIWWNDTPE